MQMDRWVDGQKDMMKLIVAFCNFVNSTKNNQQYLYFLRLSMSFSGGMTACIYPLCIIPFAWESYCRHEV
jgi:hypothetical protein